MALFTLVKCLVIWKNEIKTKLSQLMQRGKEGLYERLRRWSDQYRQDGRTGQVKGERKQVVVYLNLVHILY